MKPIKTIIALGLAGFVIGASAQSVPATAPHDSSAMPCMEGHHHGMEGHMGRGMARHAKELHDKLKLNAEQDAAWQALETSMKPPTGEKRPDIAAMEKLTAPERMEKMMDHMKQHEDAMAARLSALKTFYAKLSPEQQKTFDTETLAPWKKMSERAGHRHDGKPKSQ